MNPILGGCITGGVLAANGARSLPFFWPVFLEGRAAHDEELTCTVVRACSLSAAGPQAMAFGCAGFAAFSAAIDALGFGQFD